ncbi:MAG: HFX_2341 family transcriptional regulator domain-containing protein [Promethearchaeota archaeon]
MKQSLRVHIIPVGDDIMERLFLPARMGRADKVYFITFSGDDIFGHVLEATRNRLIKEKVLKKEDIIEIRCDFYNFTELLSTYADLIRQEKDVGNQVFINLSTGGKLNGIAGMLACMLFNARPYFCKKDFVLNEIPEPPQIIEFPRYHIEPPSRELVQFLHVISKYMKSNRYHKISKGECLDLLKGYEHQFKDAKKSSGDYNKLKFRYLDKLRKHQYIIVEDKPRGHVLITEEGRFALEIFRIFYHL